jgi:uncharacterized protein (TIGR02271 family)
MATERIVTALYESRSAAENARDQLVGLGIPSSDIDVRGAESAGTPSEGGSTPSEERGFWSSLFMPDEDRHTYSEGMNRGGYALSARVPEGLEDAAMDTLEQSGAVDLDAQAESWRQSGWTGGTSTAGTSTFGTPAAGVAPDLPAGGGVAEAGVAYQTEGRADQQRAVQGGDEVIQAAEEQLRVGKREVGRGSVRVRSYVTERPVEEQVELRQEHVTIERRPVDRELAAGDAAFQERTIEAVERGEEAVVSKTARVTEEIGIRKDVESEVETVRDTVRKQEIEVEDTRTGRGGLTDADQVSVRDRSNV